MGRPHDSPTGNGRARVWRLVMLTTVLRILCHSAAVQPEDSITSLRKKYQSLTQQLSQNQFHRPLYLESQESPSAINGNIYGVVDYPFSVVSGSLNDKTEGPANWCDVLILHLNIKYCSASTSNSGIVLVVNIGKKTE
nr:hypothetical protein [Cupriavidus sp. USMAHM13]